MGFLFNRRSISFQPFENVERLRAELRQRGIKSSRPQYFPSGQCYIEVEPKDYHRAVEIINDRSPRIYQEETS